jgi:NitT/TauT family transport system permease protein/sulfonate transport system permease protein
MRLLRSLLGLATFIGVWQLVVGLGLVESFLLPSPWLVLQAIIELGREGSLLTHIWASLQRVLIGFALATVIGLTLGFLTGAIRPVAELIKPVVEALRPIPPLAWIPLAIVWFGIGDAPSYFLVFIGAVFPVFVGTHSAVLGLDRTQINAALSLGAGPWLLFRDVIVPPTLTVIFPALRIALGIGWMCVVTAELIAAQSGLGYLIQQSRLLFQIQNVVAGMVIIGVVGFGMSALMERMERRINHWSPAGREAR